MPWTELRYPPAMNHLPEATRAKAIEIANALLDEGSDEGRAIRIGIAGAKRWAAHHGIEQALRPGPVQPSTGWRSA